MLYLPSFQTCRKVLEKNYDRRGIRRSSSSGLAKSKLVRFNQDSQQGVKDPKGRETSLQPQYDSIKEQIHRRPTYCLPLLKRRFQKAGLWFATQNLALQAWKEGT